jgi:predicted O-methyltransferase YrrM
MPASFFPTDPDENAASLSNLAEVLFGCLDAAQARTVVEVGAFHGKSTNEMLAWAERNGARLIAIDPEPQPDLAKIAGPA